MSSRRPQEAVVVLGGDGVEFVAVATGAGDGEAEEGAPGEVDLAVDHVRVHLLFVRVPIPPVADGIDAGGDNLGRVHATGPCNQVTRALHAGLLCKAVRLVIWNPAGFCGRGSDRWFFEAFVYLVVCANQQWVPLRCHQTQMDRNLLFFGWWDRIYELRLPRLGFFPLLLSSWNSLPEKALVDGLGGGEGMEAVVAIGA